MSLFYAVINVCFLFFLAVQFKKRNRRILHSFYWPALGVKLLAGIAVGLIYTYYYDTGDTFAFFNDGVVLADFARTDFINYIGFLWSSDASYTVWHDLNFLQSRAVYMAKVVSLVCLVSHNNYWITSLYFSFASFISAWLLVEEIVRRKATLAYPAAIALLFFPSIALWSSGLIKESLAMACVYFLAFVVLKGWFYNKLRVVHWIFLPLAIWVGWKLKYYFLVVFGPVALAGFAVQLWYRYRPQSLPLYGVIIWMVVVATPVLLVGHWLPNFHPSRFLDVVLSNYEEFRAISDPADIINYHELHATLGSVLHNAPWALFSGFFRKLPWEADTLFQFLSAIENTVLLVLSGAALMNVKKMITSPDRILLFSILTYCVLLCLFLALSTPNFGTLSRYRVGFLPFYLVLISIENPLLQWILPSRQR